MSEFRVECYNCINNSKCCADYKSIYCTIYRKYNFNNIDYGKGKDKCVISIDVNVLKSRIDNLNNKLLSKSLDSKERFEINGMIKAYEAILNL